MTKRVEKLSQKEHDLISEVIRKLKKSRRTSKTVEKLSINEQQRRLNPLKRTVLLANASRHLFTSKHTVKGETILLCPRKK